jgi:hypothetical protein
VKPRTVHAVQIYSLSTWIVIHKEREKLNPYRSLRHVRRNVINISMVSIEWPHDLCVGRGGD